MFFKLTNSSLVQGTSSVHKVCLKCALKLSYISETLYRTYWAFFPPVGGLVLFGGVLSVFLVGIGSGVDLYTRNYWHSILPLARLNFKPVVVGAPCCSLGVLFVSVCVCVCIFLLQIKRKTTGRSPADHRKITGRSPADHHKTTWSPLSLYYQYTGCSLLLLLLLY